jgi:hypothetical protein
MLKACMALHNAAWSRKADWRRPTVMKRQARMRSSSKSGWAPPVRRAARSGHRRTHRCRSQARPPQLVQGCEGLVEVSFRARVHDMKLQSESACRLLNGAQYDLGFRSFRSIGDVRATCRRRARRSSLAAESQLQDIHVLSAPAANLGESYRFSQDS